MTTQPTPYLTDAEMDGLRRKFQAGLFMTVHFNKKFERYIANAATDKALAHQAVQEKGLREVLQEHIADLYGDGRTNWSPSARRLFARKLEMILATPLTSEEAPHA